jgi:hypothetical protein
MDHFNTVLPPVDPWLVDTVAVSLTLLLVLTAPTKKESMETEQASELLGVSCMLAETSLVSLVTTTVITNKSSTVKP